MPLRERTIATLRREGFEGEPEIEQRLEMRYFGQNYHREIPIASHAPIDATKISPQRSQAFHADYVAFYGYDQPGEVVEVVGLIVTAIGHAYRDPQRTFRQNARKQRAGDDARRLLPPDGIFRDEIVHARIARMPAQSSQGPLIVEEALVDDGRAAGRPAQVHESGSLVITLGGGGLR